MVSSKERRAEVLAECDAGKGTREVALKFNVSESWVRRVMQERREQGKVSPKQTRDRRPCWAPYADWLRAQIAEKSDQTLAELQAKAAEELGWVTSDMTISRALRALRLPLKKDARRPIARPRRRRVEASRVDRFATGPRPRSCGVPR
ncbi:hypothetical protein Pla123a_43340 [Posidoniimonas polymericola]|uniref:Uncharacterized protein n=1 Tax=Posidoniimonas polymericola TaxID=2528002 RepID=A0A5C5XUC5_9BACT|nr:helix-turn-helix domain-containing protein [Posidoniimonas polymericola]TWT66906.1 hypothetical protein Pla123a_43340 [Posidoniimonas polymericola]